MKKHYTKELRAQMADGFIRAANKQKYAQRTGIAIGTLYHWAKGRRAPAKPHPRVAPPKPPSLTPSLDLGRALIVFAAIDDLLVGVPGELAAAVLSAQLRRRGQPQ